MSDERPAADRAAPPGAPFVAPVGRGAAFAHGCCSGPPRPIPTARIIPLPTAAPAPIPAEPPPQDH